MTSKGDLDAERQRMLQEVMRQQQEARMLNPVMRKWKEGADHYEAGELDESFALFDELANESGNAKYFFNCGLIEYKRGNLSSALTCLTQSIKKDRFSGIAWFLRGLVQHALNEFPLAILDYTRAIETMRGNSHIPYKQLGNPFILDRAEVLYNRAIALLQLQLYVQAHEDLHQARALRSQDDRHEVIVALADEVKMLALAGSGRVFTGTDLLKQSKRASARPTVNPLMAQVKHARSKLRSAT